MTEQVDAVVVGAGVIGLAVARALGRDGREVLVLEAAEAIGTGTSSRNSEVIHGGIYYPPGSLKARLCHEGRALLYAYCAEHGIAHRRLGKLIVATTEEERPALARIEENARASGVVELRRLDGAAARALEPELRVSAALFSPQTGILDSHRLMLELLGDLEAAGGMLALGARVRGGRALDEGVALEVDSGGPVRLRARLVVNAAGLEAQALARAIEGIELASVPERHLAKGNYFILRGRSPFAHLVYPVPAGGGLGVHSTLDLGGQTRFGPDVEWIGEPDYAVDPRRGEVFYAAIRRYWPSLPDGALLAGYAGIRPKIARAGTLAGDFLIQGRTEHGVPGLVNLYGIESPGLTAALALAEEVARRVR